MRRIPVPADIPWREPRHPVPGVDLQPQPPINFWDYCQQALTGYPPFGKELSAARKGRKLRAALDAAEADGAASLVLEDESWKCLCDVVRGVQWTHPEFALTVVPFADAIEDAEEFTATSEKAKA